VEFALFALLVMYLVPFILAAARDHPKFVHITLLNLFLGWTVVGWFAALLWAVGFGEPPTRLSSRADTRSS
jgi:hypothetical protein